MTEPDYLSVRQFGMKYPNRGEDVFDEGVNQHVGAYVDQVRRKGHGSLITDGEIKEMPLHGLHASQPSVERGPVEWNAETYKDTGPELGEDHPGHGPPIVLASQGGTNYLINGHHRVAGAIKSGKKTGKVRFHAPKLDEDSDER